MRLNRIDAATPGNGCGRRLQGSRQHYCIHKAVSRERSVDEACDKLNNDDGGCRYAAKAKFLSNNSERLKVWRGLMKQSFSGSLCSCRYTAKAKVLFNHSERLKTSHHICHLSHPHYQFRYTLFAGPHRSGSMNNRGLGKPWPVPSGGVTAPCCVCNWPLQQAHCCRAHF